MNSSPAAKRRAAVFFWSILGIVFAAMLALNALTPYLADDFTFSFSFADRDTLHSPYILLRSAYYHYHDWSGRVVVKFFAQLFTIPPKWVFNFTNAAMFCLLAFIIYKLGTGRHSGEFRDPLLLGGIFVCLWLVSPMFGQTTLWMCGSCNNLWSTAGCLAFLLPFRFYLEKPFPASSQTAPLMFLGGILAGWLYENTGAGMLVCLVLCMLWLLLCRRRIPLWMLSGFAGACIGYALLILAPGNSVRTDDSAPPAASLWDYITRTINSAKILLQYGWPLLLLFAVLFFCLWRTRPQKDVLAWPCMLFLSGIAANFAMIGSPVYYLRSTHGVFCLLTAACAACFAPLGSATLRKRSTILLSLAGIVSAVVFVFAAYDIAQYYSRYSARDAELRTAVAAGQTQIETYALRPNTRYCGAFGLPDIRQKEDWISITRCMWYGLDGLGLKTGEQAAITADDSAPVTYPPLFGLSVGGGNTD